MHKEFSREEYRTLRDEVLRKVDAAEKLAYYAAGAVGAVYAWMAASKVVAGSPLWYVPVMFPLLGGLRAWVLGRQVTVIGGYLYELERDLGQDRQKPGGWEKYRKHHAGRFLDIATRAFWLVLLIATFLFPSWYARSKPVFDALGT